MGASPSSARVRQERTIMRVSWFPFLVPFPAGSFQEACAAIARAAAATSSAPAVIDLDVGPGDDASVRHLHVTFQARTIAEARQALLDALPTWPGVDAPELVVDG